MEKGGIERVEEGGRKKGGGGWRRERGGGGRGIEEKGMVKGREGKGRRKERRAGGREVCREENKERRTRMKGTQLLTALSGFWKSIFRWFIALRMATIDCTVLL